MASVDEILAAASEAAEDEKIVLEINEDLRIVTVPSLALTLGAERDNKVNRVWFKMNKTYRGTDLSGFEAKVHYTNAAGKSYYHAVEDFGVVGDHIEFSWLVGKKAVEQAGSVEFSVCLMKTDGDVTLEFNTTTATAQCLRSIHADEEEPPGHALETYGAQGLTPEQFDAYGDGVHNDRAAFLEACEAASAQNKVLNLKQGSVYRMTGSVDLPSNLTIKGNGAVILSDIQYDKLGADRPFFCITGTVNDRNQYQHDIVLDNLVLRAQTLASATYFFASCVPGILPSPTVPLIAI